MSFGFEDIIQNSENFTLSDSSCVTFEFLLFLLEGDQSPPSQRQSVAAKTAPWTAVLLVPSKSHFPAKDNSII